MAQKSALDQALGNIGNFFGGVENNVSNFINQDISRPVQQFAGQAQQALSQLPQTFQSFVPPAPQFPKPQQQAPQPQQQAPSQGMQQATQQFYQGQQDTGGNPFSALVNDFNAVKNLINTPEGQNFVRNNLPLFQGLGDIQNLGNQIPHFSPQQIEQGLNAVPGLGFNNMMPPGVKNPVAGIASQFIAPALSVPSDLWKAGTQIGQDVNSGAINKPTTQIADFAQAGLPLLTIASLGGAGSLLDDVGSQGIKNLILNGMKVGGQYGFGFGALSGLDQSRDAKDVLSQVTGAAPSAFVGTVAGALLGGAFGPVSKYFFGGEPGRAATISEHNGVPTDILNQARALLKVSPDAAPEDVRTAWIEAMKQVHPDVGGNGDAAKIINNAYEVLTGKTSPSNISVSKEGDVAAAYNDAKPNQPLTPDIIQQVGEVFQKAQDTFSSLRAKPEFAPLFNEVGSVGKQPLDLVPTQPAQPSLNAIAKTAVQQTNKTGGVTINLQGQMPKEGYAFSPSKDTELTVPEADFNKNGIQHARDYAAAHVDLLNVPGNHIGMWKYDGKIYFDISQVNPNIDAAMKNAVDNKQLALYNLKTGDEIKTPLHPDYEKERINSNAPNSGQIIGTNTTRAPASSGTISKEGQVSTQIPENQVGLTPDQLALNQVKPAQPVVETPSAKLAVKTPEEKKLSLARTKVAEKAAEQVAPIAPGSTFNDKPRSAYDPDNILDGKYAEIADRILKKESAHFGEKRDLVRLEQTREGSGHILQAELEKQIKKDLPNRNDRVELQYALGGSTDPLALDATTKAVFDKVKIINNIISDLRAQRDPEYNPLENYAPLYAKQPKLGRNPLISRKILSTYSPENVHREIRAFEPVEGGNALIGKAERLGLTPSGGSADLFENDKGVQFKVRPATQKEGEGIGIRYEQDAAKTLGRNVSSALRLKERTDFINDINSGVYAKDISVAKQPGWAPIPMDGLRGLYASPEFSKTLVSINSKRDVPNIGIQAWDTASGAVRTAILTNVIVHPLNMGINALIGSGRAGILGPARFVSNIPSAMMSAINKDSHYIDVNNDGIELGMFGRNVNKPGMFQRTALTMLDNPTIAKIAGGLDAINPVRQFFRFNQAAVGLFDDTFRIAINDALQQSGKSTLERAKIVNRFLVDYGNTSNFEKNVVSRFLIFYPFLKGEAGMIGEMALHSKTNAGPLVVNALLLAMLGAAGYELQQITGNKDANFRAPGILGLEQNIAGIPGEIIKKEVPNLLVSHLNPIVKEGIAQTANVARLNDIFKPTAQPIYDPYAYDNTSESSARLNHLTKGIAAPWNSVAPVVNDKKTPAEWIANQLGVYTPHLQGYQAVPNDPNSSLNAPKAKPGTGLVAYKQKQDLIGQADAKTQLDLQQYNRLSTQAFNNQDYVAQQMAWQTLRDDPNALQLKTQIEINNAKTNGTPLNPLWALGVVDPRAQQIVLAYKAIGYAGPERTAYKKQYGDVINAYNAAISDYYKQKGSEADVTAQKFGIQAPTPSQAVQDLLNKAKSTKNYSLYNDSRVQDYFNQLDFYDSYVRSQFGLSGSGYGSSSGGGSSSGYNYHKAALLSNIYNVIGDTKNINVPLRFKDQSAAAKAIFKLSPGVDWEGLTAALNKDANRINMDKFKYTPSEDNKISVKSVGPADVTLHNSLGRIL